MNNHLELDKLKLMLEDSKEDDIQVVLATLLPELVGYFMRRLRNIDDAADAAADTIEVLLRKQNTLPSDTKSLRRYSFGVAKKVLLQAYKRRLMHSELAEKLKRELVETSILLPTIDDELSGALSRLGHKDRELLLLVAWEGFTVAEAGAILRLSAPAARKRYSRVRARLRTELDN